MPLDEPQFLGVISHVQRKEVMPYGREAFLNEEVVLDRDLPQRIGGCRVEPRRDGQPLSSRKTYAFEYDDMEFLNLGRIVGPPLQVGDELYALERNPNV